MSWVVKVEWPGRKYLSGAHYEPAQMWRWAADLRARRLQKAHGPEVKVTVISRARYEHEQKYRGQ